MALRGRPTSALAAVAFVLVLTFPPAGASHAPTAPPPLTRAVVSPSSIAPARTVALTPGALPPMYSVDLTTGTRFSGSAPGSPEYSPTGAAFVPSLRAWFVADAGSDALTEVDARTFQVLTTIPLPGSPGTPGYDRQTGELFVPLTDGNVSVVGAANASLVATIPLGPGPIVDAVPDPSGRVVYLSDQYRSSVDVVDAEQFSLRGSVAVDAGPDLMTVAPDGSRLWVACASANRVDGLTLANLTVFSRTPVAAAPVEAAYDPVLDRVFAGAVDGGNITEFNGTDGSVVGRIPIAHVVDLVYDPVSDRVWVSAQFRSSLGAYDPSTSSWTATVATPLSVTSLAVEASDGRLLTTSSTSNGLSFVATVSPRVLADVPLGVAPLYLGGDPLGGTVWASDPIDGWVVPLNTTSLALGAASPEILAPGEVASDPGRGEVYVPSTSNDTVAILDSSNLSWISAVAVGAGPTATCYLPTNHRLFVADSTGRSVSVVDVASRSLVGSYPVGSDPSAFAYDSQRSLLFVANYASANVTEINVTSATVVRSFAVGADPRGIAFDPSDDRLFVGSERNGTVSVINLSFPGGTSTLIEGSSIEGVAYDAATGTVWVADVGAGVVAIVNASTTGTISSVRLPGGATPLWLDPATAAAWVGAYTAGSVTVLRTGDAAPLVAGGVVPEPANGSLGFPVDLVSIAQGGTGPLTFAYAGLPAGCASQNLSTLTCLPAIDGTFNVTSWANDSENGSARSTTSFTVAGWRPPSLTYLAVNPSTTDLGVTVNVTVGVADGTPPLSYAYSGLPAGCLSANRSTLTCTPRATGTDRISVVVTDAQGRSTRGSRSLTVAPSPAVLSVSLSPAVLETGLTASISADASNGTPPYSYTWAGLPTGCLPENQSSIVCTPGEPVEGNLTVEVSDSLGETASRTVPLSVVPAPTILRFAADRPNVTVGRSARVSVETTGGAGPLHFAYSGIPPGCSAGNVSVWRCAPSVTGTYRLGVSVTDPEGGRAAGVLALVVRPPPEILSFALDPNEVAVGDPLSISVLTVGGTLPVTLAFDGLPGACAEHTAASWSCTPTTPGRFEVTVSATDAWGVGSNATRTLQVDAPPPSTPVAPSSSVVPTNLAVLLVGVLGVAVGGTLVWRRRRSR